MPWHPDRRARQSQKMSPALRNKIIKRDRARGCWFKLPGCTGYSGKIEIHHIEEVADGGTDDNEDLLVAACRNCHQQYSAHQSAKRAWDWQRKPERHPGVLSDDEL